MPPPQQDVRIDRLSAFTLAEVLITLGIIGVVAALTMPSLIAKHQKQVTVNRLKKAYSALSQMVVRTYSDNGAASDFLSSGDVVSADKTKQFFETYWLPYFNGSMVANDSFSFYPEGGNGFPYKYLTGSVYGLAIFTSYREGRILFSTQDGTIYFVILMSWNNEGKAAYTNIQNICIDINGVKPPNTLGKDVFRFSVDFNNNIVRPECYNFSMTDINNNCKKNGSGTCCAAKIINDGWQIKDDYPW